MNVIDGPLPSQRRGRFARTTLRFGAAGLAAFLVAGCNSTSGGQTRSASVVYEHERFGSPEIRTPQLRGQ